MFLMTLTFLVLSHPNSCYLVNPTARSSSIDKSPSFANVMKNGSIYSSIPSNMPYVNLEDTENIGAWFVTRQLIQVLVRD
jgi:hypothetical protein